MSSSQTSFLTIITRDYYWWAKTWADSVAKHHPEARIIVAIADTPNVKHQGVFEDYELVTVPNVASELGIENYSRMAFQYTPFELTCALKPYLIRYLHQTCSKVVYMDADIFVCRPLQEVFREMEQAEIVATPHLSSALDALSELRIRNAGTLNGGFLGTRKGAESESFLNWWADRCAYDCYVDPFAGKFVDQSWLDLAAHYYDAFRVIRDETLNVAYWNMATRKLAFANDQLEINGRPIGFFHFSGFDPYQPEQLSRFSTEKLNDALSKFASQYREALIKNRRQTLDEITSEYSVYRNGVAIDPLHREAIRGRYTECLNIADPFESEGHEEIVARLESVRDQAILARKHWQLDELQRLADLQTEWIQKKTQRKLNKRIAQAIRRFCLFFKDRVWSSGPSDPVVGRSKTERKVA